MAYISEKILDILKEGVEDTAFIIDAMLSSRPESYRKFRNSFASKTLSQKEKDDKNKVFGEKQKLFITLNRLKKEGFIRGEKKSRNTVWSITKKGIDKLGLFKKLSLNSKNDIKYKKETFKSLVIVAFDIPERLRGCRAWLREVLKFLGFSMIQKSVWVGNCKIPEAFIIDLEKKEILKHVDIFEVGNKGTLQRLNIK